MKRHNLQITDKRVMTFKQACLEYGLTASWLYKHTSLGTVPCSRPSGKLIFFDRQKLEEWLLGNAAMTTEQKDIASATYATTH